LTVFCWFFAKIFNFVVEKRMDMKRIFLALMLVVAAMEMQAASHAFSVEVSNSANFAQKDAPVVIALPKVDFEIGSALVTLDGKEVASQMDDLDDDGIFDELCFLTDIKSREEQIFKVVLTDEDTLRHYEPRVFAEMLLRSSNKNLKKNRQDLFISSLTAEGGSNVFPIVHHHGPAFESELVAYRIYFDHRQTVDLYGKRKHRLELRETQFYPDAEQLGEGFGDDILWAGDSFGLGALWGWDGDKAVMLKDLRSRTERVVANGPLRTIVEIEDRGWRVCVDEKPRIKMITRYILYAGHRDCVVEVNFDHEVNDYLFATGFTRIDHAKEFSDHGGLRGCWGDNWTVAAKDTAGHQREVLGLGMFLPEKNVVSELQADAVNFPFVVGNIEKSMTYYITFCSAKEETGFRDAESWFSYLRQWRKTLENPLKIVCLSER